MNKAQGQVKRRHCKLGSEPRRHLQAEGFHRRQPGAVYNYWDGRPDATTSRVRRQQEEVYAMRRRLIRSSSYRLRHER